MASLRPRLTLILGTAACLAAVPAAAQATATPDSCGKLAQANGVAWPQAGTRLVSAAWHEAGLSPPLPAFPGGPPPVALTLPAHCEVIGALHERTGIDGQHYAIRFHLRMPAQWNGRFFMEGGGGTDGNLGDAIGRLSAGIAPALAQGYAVMSEDSGHDNATNTVPAKGGASAFGFDPQARADYGGASLRPSVEAARAVVRSFYGRPPRLSYFVGCSKGGQEGMMLAQRYPDLFDGIVAGAPGFALPRAAVAEAWDTQAFASIVTKSGQPLTPASLAASFSAGDFQLLGNAILAACDKSDGVVDGMIGDFTRCTSAEVLPALTRVTCAGSKQDSCLSATQVDALRRVHDGARNSAGDRLYAGFFWDAGWADIGWRIWKIGMGPVPSINIAMASSALGAIFTVPPTVVPAGPENGLSYDIAFNFDTDTTRINATDPTFVRSAWQDIGAHSPDLDAFRKRGGKLIVPQGVSDPVFSLQDTIAWYKEVQKRYGDNAASFARLFAVPGMNHCNGGPATDQFDTLGTLVDWVEHDKAPDRIIATAGPTSPWPGRTRPLCAFPKTTHYNGKGDVDKASSFTCT